MPLVSRAGRRRAAEVSFEATGSPVITATSYSVRAGPGVLGNLLGPGFGLRDFGPRPALLKSH